MDIKLNLQDFDNVIIYQFGKVGREGHTYYKHIYDNYENLSDYTIFLQANPFLHSPNIISDLNKYVNNTELNIDFEFLSKDILNSNLSGCPSEPELPLINTYEKLFNEKRNIWHSSLEQVLNLLYQKKILQNLKKFYLTR